jgi:hypothetical protein
MKNRKDTEPARKPVHKIRHGAVSASIWHQETPKGPLFNVTFQRSYKEGETWKNSTSFGKRDLLVLGHIASLAFEWIGRQSKAKNTGENREQPDDVPF